MNLIPKLVWDGVAPMVIVNSVFAGVIVRLRLYLPSYAPPVSLGRRLTRLLPIIPSYDQVFLAPIAAVAVAVILARGLKLSGVPLDITAGITVAMALVVLVIGKPERRAWQLTAHHRIRHVQPVDSNLAKAESRALM
jgi:hypothetical protein